MAVLRPRLRHLLALLCVLLLAPAAASAHEGHVPKATAHEGHVPKATAHEEHVPKAAADEELARGAAHAVPDLVSPCPGGRGGCCCDSQPASSGSPHVEVAAAGPARLASFAARSTEPARNHGAAAAVTNHCLTSCRPRAPPAP